MERPTRPKPKGESSSGPAMTFVGQARLPQSCNCTGSGVVCVALEVDPASGQVVGLGSQGMLPCCGLLLQEVLPGHNLDRGLEEALQEMQRRFVGPPQKAVCSAIANAHEAFLRSCRQGEAGQSHQGIAFPGASSHRNGSTQP